MSSPIIVLVLLGFCLFVWVFFFDCRIYYVDEADLELREILLASASGVLGFKYAFYSFSSPSPNMGGGSWLSPSTQEAEAEGPW